MIKTFFGIWNETRLDLNTERFRTAIWYCNSATKVSLLPECLRTILRNKWNHNGIEIVAKGYIKLQTLFFFRHPNSLLAINHTMIFIIWLIVVHCKFRYFLLQLKFYCRLIKYCFYQSELHLLVLSRSQRITRKTVFTLDQWHITLRCCSLHCTPKLYTWYFTMILDSGEENCHRISVWDLKGLTTNPQQSLKCLVLHKRWNCWMLNEEKLICLLLKKEILELELTGK